VTRNRHSVVSASLDPKALAVVRKAFDAAWITIAGNYGSEHAIESSRAMLASIILEIADDAILDADQIKHAALQIMSCAAQPVPLRDPTRTAYH
jgi:hypothetical protein